MTKTRLYLDVDGVINASFANHEKYGWGGDLMRGRAAVDDGFAYLIQWSPRMIQALSALDLDLVWTTTWRNAAVSAIAPLVGFGGTGRVLHPYDDTLFPGEDEKVPTRFPSIEWKTLSVVRDQERDPSPFLWFDDEIDLYEMRIAEDLGGLAIGIEYSTGIRPEDIERAKAYIEKSQGTEVQ